MGPDKLGAAIPEETATNTTTNTDQDAGRSQSTNGDGAGDSREGITWDGRQSEQDARAEFVFHLLGLNVSLWVAERNPRGPDGAEFTRPRGWPTLTADKNIERLSTFSPGKAICANTGGKVAVVDVDPRNGGDIEKVRALLDELGVRIYGELHTPGDGRHFYVQGHPELPSVHSTAENNRLPGYPGVDIQSFACNVFLPCTERPKYQGKGYTVVVDDLQVLTAEGDPKGGEAQTGRPGERGLRRRPAQDVGRGAGCLNSPASDRADQRAPGHLVPRARLPGADRPGGTADVLPGALVPLRQGPQGGRKARSALARPATHRGGDGRGRRCHPARADGQAGTHHRRRGHGLPARSP